MLSVDSSSLETDEETSLSSKEPALQKIILNDHGYKVICESAQTLHDAYVDDESVPGHLLIPGEYTKTQCSAE